MAKIIVPGSLTQGICIFQHLLVEDLLKGHSMQEIIPMEAASIVKHPATPVLVQLDHLPLTVHHIRILSRPTPMGVHQYLDRNYRESDNSNNTNKNNSNHPRANNGEFRVIS